MVKHFLIAITLFIGATLLPQTALAHRSGCHTLHSCPSDSSTYVCGDLGYPCDGSSSINDVPLSSINVPQLVEVVFKSTFDRDMSLTESSYWKNRFRTDKASIYKVRRVMAWHKANDSFGPKATAVSESATTKVRNINALFRLANAGRNPTVSENTYWVSRIKDKATEDAMQGAMAWHRVNNISH